MTGPQEVLIASIEELPFAAQNAIEMFETKHTGSIQNDTRCKSLLEHWMTPKKSEIELGTGTDTIC